MKFRSILLALTLVVLLSVSAVRAQTATPPVLLLNGDLVQVQSDGTLTPLTQDGNILSAVISPDGAYLAYVTYSPLSVDALARVGPIGGGALPADIWIVPVQAAEPFAVATQPADASFFTENVEDNALLRSTPTWSPDATKLAWAELHYPSFAAESNRVMVYDLATGTTNTLVNNLPASAGVPSPLDVRWGSGGIAVLSFQMDTTTAAMLPHFQIYDPASGALLADTVVPEEGDKFYADFGWVTMPDGTSMLGVLYGNGTGDLINPTTGERQAAPGMVERYSLADSANTLGLVAQHNSTAADPLANYTWSATTPTGEPLPLADVLTAPGSVALSGDGQAVAFLTPQGGLSIWRQAEGSSVLLPDGAAPVGLTGVFWGPEGWRLSAVQPTTTTPTLPAETPAAPVVVCGPTLPIRLTVGGTGRVLPGLPNVLRSLPNRTPESQIVGEIPAGDTFTVQAGPECDVEGHNWWQVNYNGTVGWTAEGDSVDYWVEPVQ
ncbi:MAG TPA: SH3 domain-containing protein [Aggregatilineaceae bacterium]|nr:SH3 domain-containing protein [Aggregatilineaceae bacterium]